MTKSLTSFLSLMLFFCFCSVNSLQAIAWSQDVKTISPQNSSTETNNQRRTIGIDAAGNTVAIWEHTTQTTTELQFADLPKGGVWSSPLLISSIPQSFSLGAQIAVNPSGYAVVVWTEPSGLKAATRQFGGNWSLPLTIPTMTTDISTPQVAINSAGNAIAVWQDNISIFSSRLAFGSSSWSPVILVSPISEIAAFQPRLGMDSSGNAVAIWQNQSTTFLEAATLLFGSSSWSPIATLSSLDIIEPSALAVNEAGFTVAAWIANTGPSFITQAAVLPSIGGIWSSPHTFPNVTDASTPTVAIDLSGNAIALWAESNAPDSNFIQSAYLPFGSSNWEPPLNVTPPINTSCACDPAVGFDAIGNAVATWHTIPDIFSPTPTDIIQAATLTKGASSWSQSSTLYDANQISDFPQVAVDPTGYAVVSWINDSLTQIQATIGVPPPTIVNLSQDNGPTSGGNQVIITGTNFLNVSTVNFGVAHANFTVVSPTTLIAIVPPGGSSNTITIVNVTVTTSAGTSPATPTNQYAYQDPPAITDVNPNNGPTTGGNQVTITGTNFLKVSSVHFGLANADFTVISPTTIVATAPPGGAHNTSTTVNIRVTTTIETSPITSSDRYTYQNPPTISQLNPNRGPSDGGNIVLITGTNFLNVSSVTFGETNAISFTVLTPISISAIVPQGTAGSIVDVRVTNVAGTSPITSTDQYTYQHNNLNFPTVTKVDPNHGPSEGGNTVIITGTNFNNVSSVFFGRANAISFSVLSTTSIRAVAPSGIAGSMVDVRVTNLDGTSPIAPNDQYTYQRPAPPKTPSRFVGVIKENKYLNKTEYLLKATWDPSPSSHVVLYRIYKRGKVVKKIKADDCSSSSLVFETFLHSKKSAKGYSLTAVNSDGLESRHVKLRIVHD